MKIGESILNMRKEQEMTQEEFASIFAVTRQTVSNWEKEKSYPDLQTLVSMSDRFEVSLDSMLKGDEEMVKKFDRQRKFNRLFKRGVLILGAIIIFFCAAWSMLWYDTKREMEKAFLDGVEQFGFSDNTSEEPDEDFFQYPYRLEEEGATFLLEDMVMSDRSDIRYLGMFNQVLLCRVQRDDGMLQVEWYGNDADVTAMYTYDQTGRHFLKDQEIKRLLRDDKQMKEINAKAHEMCGTLFTDYKWDMARDIARR